MKEVGFTYKWNKGWFMIARDFVKLVNGETCLQKVKLNAWAKLKSKTWQVWKNAKGSSCLRYTD